MKSIDKKFKCIKNFLSETFFASILGFIVIAFMLFILSNLWPGAYIFLTKWANQPYVPEISRCEIILPNSNGISSLHELQHIKQYCVRLTLSNPPPIKSNIFIFSPNDDYGLHRSCNFNSKEKSSPYFIFDSEHQTSNILTIGIEVDDNEKKFNAGTLSIEDCPLDARIIWRKK